MQYQDNSNGFPITTSVTPIPMENQSVVDSLSDQYTTWHFRTPVFIDAPTGAGKTTFVYEKLLPDIISQGKKMLIVSNRVALSLQQKEAILQRIRELDPASVQKVSDNIKELADLAFIGPVCIATYQGLDSLINNPDYDTIEPYEWWANLKYAVFDEIHFLYSDALFNSYCGLLINYLPAVFNRAIRIYITATSWEILGPIFQAEAISHRYNIQLKPWANYIAQKPYEPAFHSIFTPKQLLYYHMGTDYSSYQLHFFDDTRWKKIKSVKNPASIH